MNNQIGLLINSSRGILYASKQADFAEAAAIKASELQTQMAKIIG
jgi:orotidine-5'-phosphate decarboxylase